MEKHYQYAFYHPSAEAIASMICDLPNKLALTLFFNIPFYFLANLRRSTEAFFTFYLFAFVSLLTGSMLFRTIGAMSRTLTQSIAPGAVFIMLLIVYTGFILPIPSMHPWLSWFRFINPAAYVFESLMINEVSAWSIRLEYNAYENLHSSLIVDFHARPSSLKAHHTSTQVTSKKNAQSLVLKLDHHSSVAVVTFEKAFNTNQYISGGTEHDIIDLT